MHPSPAPPPQVASDACVFEGAAKAVPYEQLPAAIRADLKQREPDMWAPGKRFDPAEPNFNSRIRFIAAARLDLRYVVAVGRDGWDYHVNIWGYEVGHPDATPEAEWSRREDPSCQVLEAALKARWYSRTTK